MRTTDMTKVALIVLLTALSGGLVEASQSSSETYQDTRRLLSEMKGYDLHPERLATLFNTGDTRIGDLVRALDDPDNEVSLSKPYRVK